MEKQSISAKSINAWRFPHASVLAGCAVLIGLVTFNGWVSDDAYITFRFLDNFFAGHGLRWNIYERVQAYTHPLWMLLHIPLYAVWDNIFLVTITLSILCTAGAIAFVLRTFERPPYITLLCFLMPLALSKIFIDFSTSGLENPLSHLLFASFGYVLIKKRGDPHFWFYCSFNTALALLNRLDTAILYLPPLAWLALPHLKSIRWRQIFLGALPLIAWFAFSLFYYGFLFPNTKYAKLNTGIAEIDYLKQGVLYFFELFSSDAFSYMILCFTLARCVDTSKDIISAMLHRKPAPANHNYTLFSISLGVITYMIYVTFIGGDFMSGRFLALPYFVTVWLVYAGVREMEWKRAAIFAAFMLALKALSLSMAADSLERCMSHIKNPFPEWGPSFCTKSGIADERAFYRPTRAWYYNGTFDSHRILDDRSYRLAEQALKDPDDIYIFGAIGALGYYAPGVRFVDFHALTDPLLARLPIQDPLSWRIGHFKRDIPDGYLFAIRHNRLDQMHPALAAYYAPLKLIVSGDLWDPRRLKTILDFNLGKYDHFKEEYLRAQRAIID